MNTAHASSLRHRSPQERLAASRQAIVHSMRSGLEEADDDRSTDEARDAFDHSGVGTGGPGSRNGADSLGSAGVSGLWRTLKRTIKAWWRSHPAHLAVEVTEPLLGKYAQNHPVKLLGVAAAVGAALIFARPWRLISVTGVLIAAVRSTQMSSLLASLLSPEPEDPRQRRS